MKFKTGIIILILAMVNGLCQTSPIYINEKDLTNSTPPQVDARAFVNQALFYVNTTPLPFETWNTLYFTNKGSGVMNGSVGFRFDYFDSTNSVNRPANTFVNYGTITGDPYLIISATNVSSPGLLLSGSAGMIHIDGSNINLMRSALRTGEIPSMLSVYVGDGYNVGTNYYYNAAGVSDYWWGTGTNNDLGTNGKPLNLTNMGVNFNFNVPYTQSPYHQVRQIMYGRLSTNLVYLPYFSLGGYYYGNYDVAAYTNASMSGDSYVSVVFYPTNNITTNFTTTVQFYPYYDGPIVPIVGFSMTDYDIVLQSNVSSYVYLIDSSAVVTNHTLYREYYTNTFRPNSFELIRGIPIEATMAVSSNVVFTNTLLYTTNYETNVVNVLYAGYAALINETNANYSSLIVNSYGYAVANPALADPTNYVGRIEIEGDDLNIIQTRIRAEKFLGIKAKNIVSNKFAQVDAPVINYDIGTTNRVLELSNILSSTVNRLSGSIAAYSAVWTNRYFQTNYVGTNATVVTNTAHFHVLIVDSGLTAAKPVVLNELAVRATNLVIYDYLMVAKSVYFDGEGLKIAKNSTGVSGLTLPLNQDWSSTNFPKLKSLTNENYLVISGVGNFYLNTTITNISYPNIVTYTNVILPYDNIVNSGLISAATFAMKATNFVNSGDIYAAQGVFSLEATNSAISGQVISKGDLSMTCQNLTLSNAVISAGEGGRGALILSVTNILDDGGVNSTNIIKVNDGITIGARPSIGDLRNTVIQSKIERYAEVSHTFNSRNLGVTPAGFTNNMAIGCLILDADDVSRIVLKGTGTNDALYVDYIEFRNFATNYSTTIYVETNLTIYFANANLSVNKLNKAFGGRAHWVPNYAGKFSSSYITNSNGQVVAYNSALIYNPDLDSDRDGMPNLFDTPMPFPTDSDFNLQISQLMSQSRVSISWNALERSTNSLEVTTNIVNTRWQTLTNFVNTGATTRVNYIDVLSNTAPRFYRVRVDMTLP